MRADRTAQLRRKPLRRWLRRIGIALLALLLLASALYGWAWASVDSSTIARAMMWREADVDDQRRFPFRRIATGADAMLLPRGTPLDVATLPGAASFEDRLRRTDTFAFLVVHRDAVVFERYLGGADKGSLLTSFSVAKSVLSTLVGIAIDEGVITSIDDAVTKYVPELSKRDRRFDRITLRDLLTMSSGLRYWESDLPIPWTDDAYTYYGTDLRDLAINGSRIENVPRREWKYNNFNPLLLGIVLERATRMSVSEYMSSKLWRPLRAERDATWSLDSKGSGFEKMESGLNATAADYARFGLLFLHRGELNGKRIVSTEWVRAATAVDTTTDPASFFQYYWWNDEERPGRFYALGNFGQYIYVAPEVNAVVVRNGRDWGMPNRDWLTVFRSVADQLASTAR